MTEADPQDELARRLFEAARQERPSDDVRRRAQLGVTSDSGAAFALEMPLIERGAASAARRTPAARYAPALLAALALGAATLWLVLDARRSATREDTFAITPEQSPVPPRPQPQAGEWWHRAGASRRRDVVAASFDEARAAQKSTTQPATPARPRPAAAGNAAPQPRAMRVASLAEEVAQLDRARAALAVSDGRRALALVDEYERVMRGTRLRAEAELLRIEALVASGERTRAAERARRFVADHPGSPLADRARALGQVETEVEIEGGR